MWGSARCVHVHVCMLQALVVFADEDQGAFAGDEDVLFVVDSEPFTDENGDADVVYSFANTHERVGEVP